MVFTVLFDHGSSVVVHEWAWVGGSGIGWSRYSRIRNCYTHIFTVNFVILFVWMTGDILWKSEQVNFCMLTKMEHLTKYIQMFVLRPNSYWQTTSGGYKEFIDIHSDKIKYWSKILVQTSWFTVFGIPSMTNAYNNHYNRRYQQWYAHTKDNEIRRQICKNNEV